VDPPVNSGGQAPSSMTVPTGSNHILNGSVPGDNFAFNFSGLAPNTGTDFHPALDWSQLGHAAFANGLGTWNGAHDDAHGTPPIAGEGHDAFTSTGILKAHLHAAEFHFV
jgi:hypothetical protein